MLQLSQTDMILWRTLLIFLLSGGLLGVAVSLLLIFKPHLLPPVNQVANQWVSTSKVGHWLDQSISMEQWFYRHHRPFGIFLSLAGGYILIYFGLLLNKTAVLQSLAPHTSQSLASGSLDAFQIAAMIGSILSLTVGLLLWLRPHVLRGIDHVANRWVSSRSAADIMDIPHSQGENFVSRHARPVGVLLLLGNLYMLFVLARLF